jgi:hypothetical protein
MVEFLASDSTRSEIFWLAQQLNFFQGEFKISRSASPNISTKSLTFTDGSVSNQITYTSSKNPLIKQFTRLFENVSATLEFGRRLERLRHSNPSGLTLELKRMESRARHGGLVDFRVIARLVQEIASDAAIPDISRQYARAILKRQGLPTELKLSPQKLEWHRSRRIIEWGT